MTEDVVRKQYRELTEEDKTLIAEFKENGNEFLGAVDFLLEVRPEAAREFAIAKTKMEETIMWLVKGLTK